MPVGKTIKSSSLKPACLESLILGQVRVGEHQAKCGALVGVFVFVRDIEANCICVFCICICIMQIDLCRDYHGLSVCIKAWDLCGPTGANVTSRITMHCYDGDDD